MEQRAATLREMLTERAREALRHWTASPQTPVLLKYRENAVFRVILAGGRHAALRLHRPGYHREDALRSELDWMAALKLGGLAVPSPVASDDGRVLVRLPASAAFPRHYADVVGWMDGSPLGESGKPLAYPPHEQTQIFFRIGAAMAAMHDIADAWPPPRHFRRPAWDKDGLLGESPLWGRFWDCPGLHPEQERALATLRLRLQAALSAAEATGLDYGLIHADLVRENILVARDRVAFIDFDDAGYGFRLFDLATTLLKNRSEPGYRDIEHALISGYRSRRDLSDETLRALPLFLVLRSVTYIGWLADRPEIPDAGARLTRYISESLRLARDLPPV